jgi:hypothetical protein
MMMEYRIFASFNEKPGIAPVAPRSFKRKIFSSREEAEKCLPEAIEYYSSCFAKLDPVVCIQSRFVSAWDRHDLIAAKTWSEEDIVQYLYDHGYSTCRENIDLMLGTGVFRNLSDCTDQDWDTFDCAEYLVKDRLITTEGRTA